MAGDGVVVADVGVDMDGDVVEVSDAFEEEMADVFGDAVAVAHRTWTAPTPSTPGFDSAIALTLSTRAGSTASISR